MVTAVAEASQQERDRWRYICILVGVLGLLVAVAAQLILLVPTNYTATSVVALRPLTADVAADTLEMQAHEYGVALGAKEAVAAVQAETDPTGEQPTASVATAQDPGTSTVRIAVTSTDRDTSVAVANGLAEHAEDIGRSDSMAEVAVVVEAGSSGVTSDPPRNLYFAALFCLAVLVLGGGLYRIREHTS